MKTRRSRSSVWGELKRIGSDVNDIRATVEIVRRCNKINKCDGDDGGSEVILWWISCIGHRDADILFRCVYRYVCHMPA